MPPDTARSVIFRFLRELPYLPSAADLGVATSAVEPWPHQLRVIRRVVERFPQSFLFADEVGLGKTVQAALALRSLWLTGRVERALILVPKALLRQWQEELHEKAALAVARFEGGLFFDVRGRELPALGPERNPWDRHDLILASTQLARAPNRQREILSARRWDLVIVDEAHHARRRQLTGPYRPNRLLELLSGSGASDSPDAGQEGLRHRTRALYLLTATPMQIHPVEVRDLLRLLGLGGRFGADEDAFIGYFEQLKKPFEKRDWELLQELADDAKPPPEPARLFFESARQSLPAAKDRRDIDDWLRRATPLDDFIWRHTRPLLRRYQEQGLLASSVPERRPKNVWVELSPRQRRLYRRIESYLSEFYQRYEARRSGLGFVMTVYRRRLTSSFNAVRKSLERRRSYLLGHGHPSGLREDLAEDGDGEQASDGEGIWGPPIVGHQQELDLEKSSTELPVPTLFSRDELEHLEAILDELAEIDHEPKLERLASDLGRFLRRRDRVLVFTQYLDTLDQLREFLSRRFRVACYSGRGGEVLRDGRWQSEEKELLKNAFAEGEIQVLLCTEAASEGLNLQTCGVLINYDMPWNPMRVEQRIGRIDRIGQIHPRIWIRNYFYADTVEATIYRRLGDRIDWFKAVLGELQPILHGVGETVERLALTPESRRKRRLEEALLDLSDRIDDLPANPLPLSDDPIDLEAPVAVAPKPTELAELLLDTSRATLLESTEEPGVFRLRDSADPALNPPSDSLVTFDPKIFAERPYSLEYLTWGAPTFERLIESENEPPSSPEPFGLGLYKSLNPAPVSVFAAPDGGTMRSIGDLKSLRRWLEQPAGAWKGDQEAEAASLFSRRRQQVLRGLQDVEAGRRLAEKSALRSEAGELLVRAACLELTASLNPGLFDQPITYDWGPGAITAQAERPGPYRHLLDMADDGLEARIDSPQAEALRALSPDRLARRALEEEERGWQIHERWQALIAADEAARKVLTDRSAGLLERIYFPLGDIEVEPSIYLEPPELLPFENAIPLLGDLADAAATLVEALEESRSSPHSISSRAAAGARTRRNPALRNLALRNLELRDLALSHLAENPERLPWVRCEGRVAAGPDLFAATVPGPFLEPKIPDGAIVFLRIDPGPPREGQLVLVDGVNDPETGGAALRHWHIEHRRGRAPRLRLEANSPGVAPIFVDETGAEELRVLAHWVDTVE